jgi:hypothetical protein
MAKPRPIKIVCDPPIKLDDDGYVALIGMIQEAMAEGDAEAAYQVNSLELEVEPLKDEPRPLTGEMEDVEIFPKDEESGEDS